MAHWAEINKNNIVVRVLVSNNDEPDEGYQWLLDNLGGTWVKTSYNTRGGVHYDPETGKPSKDQSKALRYNYAGIGFTFDASRGTDGGFIAPKPAPFADIVDYVLNEETLIWEPVKA